MSGKIKDQFTIFGGTGDLAFRKLIPALYHLFLRYRLDAKTRIVVIGRKNFTTQEYCEEVKPKVQEATRYQFKEELYKEFCEHIVYYQMDFTKEEDFVGLCQFLSQEEIQSHIFYYAVAPEFFEGISKGLMNLKNRNNIKILIEKPFGKNLADGKKLNQKLEEAFGEENIYRIDHYLGKEMVRSIQTIRFDNPIFKDTWNHHYIEKVEIVAKEDGGIGTRGTYYDQTGALKDMVQNHLLQILSIIAMEKSASDETIYLQQAQVFKELRVVLQKDISKTMMLGQYEGYLDEHGVDSCSDTETYAQLCIYVDNERWKDVPFIITTGKMLDKKEMEVILTFKREKETVGANQLRVKIQPLEGVSLKFNIKQPGTSNEVISTEMDFCQNCIARYRLNTPEAYERLLDACIQSSKTMFTRWEEIEASWEYVHCLHQLYKKEKLPLVLYPQGSSGPKAS